jgi:hypothetical protein
VVNCEPNEDAEEPFVFQTNYLDSESKIFRKQKIDKIEIQKDYICDLSNPEKYSYRALLRLQSARKSMPHILVKESAKIVGSGTSTPQIVVKKSTTKLKKVNNMEQISGKNQRFNCGMSSEVKYITCSHCGASVPVN